MNCGFVTELSPIFETWSLPAPVLQGIPEIYCATDITDCVSTLWVSTQEDLVSCFTSTLHFLLLRKALKNMAPHFFCYRRKIFFILFFPSLFFFPHDVLWLFKILQAVNKYLQLKRRISLNECSYNLVFPYVLECVFDICIFGIRAGLWTGLLRIWSMPGPTCLFFPPAFPFRWSFMSVNRQRLTWSSYLVIGGSAAAGMCIQQHKVLSPVL